MNVVLDLGFVVLLAVWAAGVGGMIARRLVRLPAAATDTLALTVPLGLGVLALGTLTLGIASQLNRTGLGLLLALGGIAAVGDRPWRRRRRDRITDTLPTEARRPLDRAIERAMAVGVLGTLLTALTPVTEGDALCYHLQVPKIFLLEGQTGFDPDLHETVYPLVVECLYAVALALRGPVACRLIQWLFGLCLAAAATALARPALGPRARWAGAIALLVPAVSNGMGAPLNDVALAAGCNAALLAWCLWFKQRSSGAVLLAGILSGLAVGIKYPALVWCGLLGIGVPLAVLLDALRSGHAGDSPRTPFWSLVGTLMRPMLAFGLSTLLIGGVWYARAYWHTGNPVFPFFRTIFGAGLDEVLDPIKRPMAVTPLNVLTALVPMTLQPDRFDSRSHQFGPVFLLLLPLLLVLRPPRSVWGPVALAYLFLSLCLTQRQSMRFVLALVGPFAVGSAWALWKLQTRGPIGRVIGIGLALVLLAEAGLTVARSRHGIGVTLGRESAESFLARREPTFVLGRWIAAHLPESARLIGQDHRGFYIPRPYTMELAHRRRTGLAGHGESPAEVVAQLRQRGYTHLVLCPPVPEDAVEFDPTLGRLLAPWLEARNPLYRADLADGDGTVRRYAIFALDDLASPTVAQTSGGVVHP